MFSIRLLAGTAAASKAVVLDASKNIATIGTIGCGAVTSTGASSFGNMTFNGTLSAASLGSIADGDIDLTADLDDHANDGAGGVIKNTSLANYAMQQLLAAGMTSTAECFESRLLQATVASTWPLDAVKVDLSDLVATVISSHGSIVLLYPRL